MNNQLVLSLFPGAGLFDKAFELEGFCVVRGPDLLMGGDIRDFKVSANRFDGVIGGPPCKIFSAANFAHKATQPNMIPEFERIVRQARPKWWVMENVTQSDGPNLPDMKKIDFDAWEVGCNQHRVRGFWSNLILRIRKTLHVDRPQDPWPTIMATEYKYSPDVKGSDRRAGRKNNRKLTLEEVNEAMGLPKYWETPALTSEMSYQVRGNGVPIQMGRAVAVAVKEALIIEKRSFVFNS